jgi:hypothetical protein
MLLKSVKQQTSMQSLKECPYRIEQGNANFVKTLAVYYFS